MGMKGQGAKRIYCAGPLFNGPEKNEMADIAEALEQSGFTTFLPQRDGLELAIASQQLCDRGLPPERANAILSRAIFALDVFMVIASDGLLLNMNGRVPDEGAMVEAGIAWSYRKPVVIYKNDARTTFNGTDNPLVLGLSNFLVVDSFEKAATVFQSSLNHKPLVSDSGPIPAIDTFVEKGKQVSDWMSGRCRRSESQQLADFLIDLFGKDDRGDAYKRRAQVS